MKAAPRIVVLGAGIVGTSIAYHLARRDAAVTLVDKGRPGAEATGASFGWINVSHGVPQSHLPLRRLAIDEYRRVERELGSALRVSWCGALTWTAEPAETMRFVREHAASGYDLRLVERAEIAALEPNLLAPPECAAYAASEGAIDPAAATEALVVAARQAGADIRLGTAAIALAAHGRRVTGLRTSEGTIVADLVVMAAGTSSGALCKQAGVMLPIKASPALLLRFRSPGRLVNTIVSNPDLEVRQDGHGHLLAAENFSDGADRDAIALTTLAAIKDGLRGAEGMQIEAARVGMRPMPADGLPVVGFASGLEGLYVAALHAGLTLAPVVGRLAAAEILDGVAAKALEGCRPDRFTAASSASTG